LRSSASKSADENGQKGKENPDKREKCIFFVILFSACDLRLGCRSFLSSEGLSVATETESEQTKKEAEGELTCGKSIEIDGSVLFLLFFYFCLLF